MFKKYILSVIAVFIAWSVMDFVLHGKILLDIYESTVDMWRPLEEMKRPLMMLVTLVSSMCFCVIYLFFGEKNLMNAVRYGFVFGVGTGFGMGFGTYSVQAIPLSLAWGWFLGNLFYTVTAGFIIGAIIKE